MQGRALVRIFLCGGTLLFSAQIVVADKVDFAKQIQPIFSASCYKCHGGTKAKGKLKLDSAEAILNGGEDGKIFEPGNPDKSDLFHRITVAADDDDAMPPKDKGQPLKKEQVALIKQWIAEGGNFGSWKSAKASPVAQTGTISGKAASASGESDDAIKEIPLPQVAPADPGALDKLAQSGAQCLPLSIGTNVLSVGFGSNAHQVTDAQVALLAPVADQIYELNLAGTKVTDEGLAVLARMKNLHRLHLERTGVTDAGLANLTDLPSLEYLNLYGTSVTDDGLQQLKALKSLKELFLWQSKVTDAGAQRLKQSLPALTFNLGWQEPPK